MVARRRTDYEPHRVLVVDRLRERCLEFGARGEVVPPESQLASELGVSRATVRDALTRLETEGLILRRKGADTIVNSAALDLRARIDLQVDFSVILADAGFVPSVTLIEAGPSALEGKEAAALGRPVGDPALRTVKRWDANGSPAMVAVDLVPYAGGDPGVDPLLPVFELASRLSGEEIGWEVALPGAVSAAGDLAAWLHVQEGTAVWTLERVGIGRTGHRRFLALEYHLPNVVEYGFVRPLRRR
jgi:GntR family transcriptional regulator